MTDKPPTCCPDTKEAAKATCGGAGACPAGQDVHASVQQYYGKDLKSQGDCQSGINCLKDRPALPKHVLQAFDLVHPEVTLRYFGCGPVIPEALEGCSILDLGSGSGRDCYAVSKLIGPLGHVIGVDMTDEQLSYARSFLDYHMDKFGYTKPNVEFRLGYIEKLNDAGIPDNTFDLVISNCVICLCQNKAAVLAEAFRALKVGGELYFSDMYTDKVVPDHVKNDHVMWGEGLGGAVRWPELYTIANTLGFSRPRLVTATLVNTSKFDQHLEGAKYVSVTYRLFKLPTDRHTAASSAVYTGGIEGCDQDFPLDHATTFTKNQELRVDSELATVLMTSRFSKYFSLQSSADTTGGETPDPMVDPVVVAQLLNKSPTTPCPAK